MMLPIVGRLPFEWIYPTGKKQEKCIPKWGKYYQWATVLAVIASISSGICRRDGWKGHCHQYNHC